jgi:hypothetical protein
MYRSRLLTRLQPAFSIEIIQHVFGRLFHAPALDPQDVVCFPGVVLDLIYDALRNLWATTGEPVKRDGSTDVCSIDFRAGTSQLLITTHLP